MTPINNSDFVHLHLHTEYSLLDGACRIDRLMEHVKSLGQTAVAITDHGVMYGCVDFFKAAKKAGIKPIIGCEVYVAQRTRLDKVHRLDSSSYHLVLLAENALGYQNLLKLVSLSNTEGFYNKPRVDRELLERYSGGLIALSACLAGEIPQALLNGDFETARETALYYGGLFGTDRFYIELQDHGLDEQRRILPELIRLSKETGIPMAATNDCHYIARSDSEMQRALICIQTNRAMDDEDVLEFATDEFYVKDAEEMSRLFEAVPEAVKNTAKIAGMCDFAFEFGVTKLPHFSAPGGSSDNTAYFLDLCRAGMAARYGDHPDEEVLSRLSYETDVIIRMGYVDYFLIVGDFIDFARKHDIPVGPGRGSGAGSLAAYCLGITGIDPIRYQLLFERFLNPERISMPDFDIDFCYEKRQQVIDYVVEKYGAGHVAQIITFGTMAARAAVRDVGRVLSIPYQDVDAVAKMIPQMPGITIQSALMRSAELKQRYDGDRTIRRLIDLSMKVEGMPRHASTHAAGVVITREEVSDYVPLQKNDDQTVTQYPMGTLEELGLLKMDFLGLRTLTVISDTEKMVCSSGRSFSAEAIPYDDREVYEMLSSGHTSGVFQFESSGMRQVLMGLKPVNIEDLIAVISLYRPGPMDSIPVYIRNRHHPEEVTYKTPLLRPILGVTYGCIVYQEQVMQIFRDLAGFSYGQADLVRRAMSKKKADIMEQEGRFFIYGNDQPGKECDGCVRRGIPERTAKELFSEMESFASYAFNKSHAAAYAVVAYQTAYLKRHHPTEYMAALLTSVLDVTERIIEYTGECQRLGIELRPPDINESGEGFAAADGAILFGLRAVKNVGGGLIGRIVEERRQNGRFRSFPEFCRRMRGGDLNKRALENLIKCGALDSLGLSRRAMIASMEMILKSLEDSERRNLSGQVNLFEQVSAGARDDYDIPDLPEYPKPELSAYEKEVTGLYLSSHPLQQYAELVAKISACPVRDVLSDETGGYDNREIELVVSVAQVRTKVTKSDATMAFVTLEDLTGSIVMLVFPNKFEEYAQVLRANEVVVVSARVSVKEDEEIVLICNRVVPASEYRAPSSKKSDAAGRPAGESAPGFGKKRRESLYLKLPGRECPAYRQVSSLLQIFDGSVPVYFRLDDARQWVLSPKKMWVAPSDALIGELKQLLGDGNVVLR